MTELALLFAVSSGTVSKKRAGKAAVRCLCTLMGLAMLPTFVPERYKYSPEPHDTLLCRLLAIPSCPIEKLRRAIPASSHLVAIRSRLGHRVGLTMEWRQSEERR